MGGIGNSTNLGEGGQIVPSSLNLIERQQNSCFQVKGYFVTPGVTLGQFNFSTKLCLVHRWYFGKKPDRYLITFAMKKSVQIMPTIQTQFQGK